MARAGELDRLVRIEFNTPTRTGSGDTIDSWALLGEECWARRMDERGREFFDAQQVTAEQSTIWRLRWRGDITASMRVVDGGDIWDIQYITESSRRRDTLQLACTRLGA